MIWLQLTIPFARIKMQKLQLVRFRDRHCWVSVILRPSDSHNAPPGKTTSPHLALGALWVWYPCIRWISYLESAYCTHFPQVIQWLLGVGPGQKVRWLTNN